MGVPERDTSQDKQFSKEKDVPAVSLANPQGALVHQNRDTEHQASAEMVGTTVLIYSTNISLVSQLCRSRGQNNWKWRRLSLQWTQVWRYNSRVSKFRIFPPQLPHRKLRQDSWTLLPEILSNTLHFPVRTVQSTRTKQSVRMIQVCLHILKKFFLCIKIYYTTVFREGSTNFEIIGFKKICRQWHWVTLINTETNMHKSQSRYVT